MERSKSVVTEQEVESFLITVRAGDTDKKVNLIQLWGLKLEGIAELPEAAIDAITLLVAPFLRSSAHLLVTSSLSFLPVFLPLVPTTSTTLHLHLALRQFLPSLLERLNDPKDKIHEPAGEAIAILGRKSYAVDAQAGVPPSVKGKEKDTNAGVWEHAIKETLAGRGARAKIGILKLLLTLRADKSVKLPLKPWLPVLVNLLEDSDGAVRDQARETVVALLSPPSTPPAARSELKKLMTQRNVRKSIADGIIQRVLGGGAVAPIGHTAVAHSDGPQSREAAPSRSGAATPATDVVPIVYIASGRDLDHEFKAMVPHFADKETEHNWQPRENALIRIRGMLRGRVFAQQPDAFLHGLKNGILEGITKTLLSLRTTVAQQACSLVQELAEYLGPAFDASVEQVLPTLGKMSGFTKRIIAERSQKAVTAIITHTSVPPRILISHITAAIQEKSIAIRQYGAAHLRTFVETQAGKQTAAIESTSGAVEHIEQALKRCLADTNAQVREAGRAAFWCFDKVWPRQAAVILGGLDGTVKKQLEKANPHLASAVPARSTPAKPRASSAMSAMLAAKRAKAAELRRGSPSPANVPLPETPAPFEKVASPLEATEILAEDDKPMAPEPAGTPSSDGHDLDPIAARSQTPTSTRTESTAVTPSRHKSQIPTPKSSRTTPMSPPRGSQIPVSTSPKSPKPYLHSLVAATDSPSPSERRGSNTLSQSQRNKASPLHERKPAEKQNTPQAEHKTHASRLSTSSLPRSRNLSPHGAPSGASSNASTRSGSSLGRSLSRSPPSLMESVHPLRHPTGKRTSAPSSEASAAPRTPVQYLTGLPNRATRASDAYHPSLQSFATSEGLRSSPHYRGSGPLTTVTPPPRNNFFEQSPIDPADEARRAQVAQGLSAAQQLLDFEDDDEEPMTVAPITPLRPNQAVLTRPSLNGVGGGRQPSWDDSPKAMTPKLLEKLQSRAYERSWWNQRLLLLDQASPLKSETGSTGSAIDEDLESLLSGSVTLRNLQKLTLFSSSNPIPLGAVIEDDAEEADCLSVWREGRLFEQIFDGLMAFLDPKVPSVLLEQAVVLLWEMVQNQWALCETREDTLMDTVFKLRSSTNLVVSCSETEQNSKSYKQILESTNSLVSLLTEVCDPTFLLSLLHSALNRFIESHSDEANVVGDAEVYRDLAISAGYNFGLNSMGMCIIQLPKESVMLEAASLEQHVMMALSLTAEGVPARQAAHRVILAVQCVLGDDVRTLALFPRLNAGQRNFVTYLMQQNGVIGRSPSDPDEDAARRRSVLDELVDGLAKGARVRHHLT